MPDPTVARLMGAMQTELRALVDAYEYLGRDEWERQARRVIVERHAAAYFAGQGTNELSAAADRELGAIFTREFAALSRFGDALEAGQLSPAQAAARATLYSGALKATHSRGQYRLWRVPVHPGEGLPCRSNCKCSIEVDVLDLEELDADVRWKLGSAEHCPVCVQRASGSPYRVRGGEWLTELR